MKNERGYIAKGKVQTDESEFWYVKRFAIRKRERHGERLLMRITAQPQPKQSLRAINGSAENGNGKTPSFHQMAYGEG